MDKDNQLQRLHEVLLEILTEFDRICRKHDIQYFLDSGTALGAVRHGGFIPWDDDIDVGLFRSEYDRLLDVIESEVSTDFIVESKRTDPNYRKRHIKLMKRGTFFSEKYSEGCINRCIFIDIFPFDNVANNRFLRWLDFRLNVIIRSIITSRKFGQSLTSYRHRIVYHLLKRIPLDSIEHMYDEFMTRRDGKTHYMTCYVYKMLQGRDIVFPKETLQTVCDIKFEGRYFKIMKDYDMYLKIMYGNYMQLPPKSKRVYHFDGVIDFGDTKV